MKIVTGTIVFFIIILIGMLFGRITALIGLILKGIVNLIRKLY